MKEYIETFDEGPGGWFGTINNYSGPYRLPVKDGAVCCRGQWWVDYNHAPPGAGYMNLLMGLYLKGPLSEACKEMGGKNNYIKEGFPTDLRNAELTMHLRGSIDQKGTEMIFLIQGAHDGVCAGWLLTGQPIKFTEDWSEQTIRFINDPAYWTALGSRHDRTDTYGYAPLERVLADVNVNIYLVMYPVNVLPKGPINGDPHILRAGYDYPLWQTELPDGYLFIDTVKINFSE